jgi:hypothetical protein
MSTPGVPSSNLGKATELGPTTPASGSALGEGLDRARRWVDLHSKLTYSINTDGLGPRVADSAIRKALSDPSLANLSPEKLDSASGSKAGTELERYARESLQIDSKDKTVGELLREVSEKLVSKTGSDVYESLPPGLKASLVAAVVATAIVSGDLRLLGKLGIQASASFSGGKLVLALKDSSRDQLELQLGVKGSAHLGVGGPTMNYEGKIGSSGDVDVAVSIDGASGKFSYGINAEANAKSGVTDASLTAQLGLNIGKAMLSGSITLNNQGGPSSSADLVFPIEIPGFSSSDVGVTLSSDPGDARATVKVHARP